MGYSRPILIFTNCLNGVIGFFLLNNGATYTGFAQKVADHLLKLHNIFLYVSSSITNFGFFIFLVAVLGFCSASFKRTSFLVLYAIVLSILLLAQIAFLMKLYKKADLLAAELKEEHLEQYKEVADSLMSKFYSHACNESDCMCFGANSFVDVCLKNTYKYTMYFFETISSLMIIFMVTEVVEIIFAVILASSSEDQVC